MQGTLGPVLILLLMTVVGTVVVLLATGLIGPKWLKDKARRQIRWQWGPSSPLLPMDPYKPIGEALSQKESDFGSMKERVRNNNIFILGQLLLTFGLLALGVLFSIFWLSR